MPRRSRQSAPTEKDDTLRFPRLGRPSRGGGRGTSGRKPTPHLPARNGPLQVGPRLPRRWDTKSRLKPAFERRSFCVPRPRSRRPPPGRGGRSSHWRATPLETTLRPPRPSDCKATIDSLASSAYAREDDPELPAQGAREALERGRSERSESQPVRPRAQPVDSPQ